MLSPHLFLCTAKTLCRRHHSFEKMIMKWKPGEADWFVLTLVSLVLITMMNCIPCCLACIPWSLTVSILKEAILHCRSPWSFQFPSGIAQIAFLEWRFWTVVIAVSQCYLELLDSWSCLNCKAQHGSLYRGKDQNTTDWGAQRGLNHCKISSWSEEPGLVPVYIGSYGELCHLLVGFWLKLSWTEEALSIKASSILTIRKTNESIRKGLTFPVGTFTLHLSC